MAINIHIIFYLEHLNLRYVSTWFDYSLVRAILTHRIAELELDSSVQSSPRTNVLLFGQSENSFGYIIYLTDGDIVLVTLRSRSFQPPINSKAWSQRTVLTLQKLKFEGTNTLRQQRHPP
ncbi:hypothetical protein LOTGIDRAFT_170161 [Lottia gigantea]|uniref:Uncharacterized protein n=1 Tax=Lottia gigantea TaxID=225164 RepID=V4B1V7_LOTGI|nr:hypothetical protein LOTGIDRAFT_170161 [Lottia gigantea]ESO82249.1 hypothetical protein LOTGIDRAFT_170161 [Lottia gigantea]